MLRTVGAITFILFLSVGCGTFRAAKARDTSVDQSTKQVTRPSKPESSQVTFREELCREFVTWPPIWFLLGCPD